MKCGNAHLPTGSLGSFPTGSRPALCLRVTCLRGGRREDGEGSIMASAAKARLEDELSRLEFLLRLLDEYEETLNEQTLLLLSQKLKVIVPELRALSLDPQYKTPECAPLLVTLGCVGG
jgi:hypothetical protein